MRTLFCKFHIRPQEEGDDVDQLLEDVAKMCWDWAAKPRDDKELSKSLPDDWEVGSWKKSDEIRVENFETTSGRLWKLSFINRGNDDPNIRWANYIFLAYSDGDLEYSLLQEAIFDEGGIRQFSSPIYPPFITRDIVDRFHCYIGDEIITHTFEHTNDGSKILEEVIDSGRELPILLLSKLYKDGRSIVNPLDFSKPLTGIAKVILVRDPNTRKFNDGFGEQFVTDGSIRIHWPNKDKSGLQEPEYDFLYTKRALKSRFGDDSNKLKEFLVNEICKATTLNFITSDLVKLILEEYEEAKQQEEEKKQQEEQKRSKEMRRQVQSATEKQGYQDTTINQLEDEKKRLSRENRELKSRIEELEGTMKNLQNQKNDLEDELRPLKTLKFLMNEVKGQNPELTPDDFEAAIRDLGRDEEEEPEPEPESEDFNTVYDALLEAKKKFGSRIIILDDALDSAKKTTADTPPIKVYELVEYLYECVYDDMRKKPLEGKNRFIFGNAMKKKYSDKYAEQETTSTKDRYSKDYNTKGRRFGLDGGGLIEIFSHLKFRNTNPLRIYLTAIHEKSRPTIYRQIEGKGQVKWKQDKKRTNVQFPNRLPTVVIGWCGDHLPTAKDHSKRKG